MRAHTFANLVAAGVMFAAPAFAEPAMEAQLTDVQGDVLVDSGEGFAPVGGQASLGPSDRIILTSSGQARLVLFAPNCFVDLKAGAVVTVRDLLARVEQTPQPPGKAALSDRSPMEMCRIPSDVGGPRLAQADDDDDL